MATTLALQPDTPVHTITNLYLNTCGALGIQPVIPPKSTVNEGLGIQYTTPLPATFLPAINYAVVGCGGRLAGPADPNGLFPIYYSKHAPSDCMPYNTIPFVLRQPNNDLSLTEMARYRLRKQIVINGVTYVAYYARVLDTTNTAVQTEYNTMNGTTPINQPFVFSAANLNPVPRFPVNVGVNVATSDYLSVTAKVELRLTPADILELDNVDKIMFGGKRMAIITDVAICSGIDQTVTDNIGGLQQSYTEALAVQVRAFHTTSIDSFMHNQDAGVVFDIGGQEMLSPQLTPVVA